MCSELLTCQVMVRKNFGKTVDHDEFEQKLKEKLLYEPDDVKYVCDGHFDIITKNRYSAIHDIWSALNELSKLNEWTIRLGIKDGGWYEETVITSQKHSV